MDGGNKSGLEPLKPAKRVQTAVCCLITNIQLLGSDKGLDVYWDVADYTDCPGLRAFAGIGDDEHLVGVLAIGFPDDRFHSRGQTEDTAVHPEIEVW